jgi:thymidine phosphorylase
MAKRGDPVDTGEIIAEVHAADGPSAAAAAAEVSACYRITDSGPPEPVPIVLDVLS